MPPYTFIVDTDMPQPISTSANHTIHDLVLCGSLACPFLLITALLPHMLVVPLMAFTEIWVAVMVETFGANLGRQGITRTGDDFGLRGGVACTL